VIARVWTGRVREEQADAYLAYLKETGVEHCRRTPGNRGVSIQRRIADGVAEFVFTSRWDSWDAIRAFAGADAERAVYYPEDRAFLLELDPHVRHFEVLVDETA
jgi:heme-degrading monooxygenase HmoA